MSGCCPNLNPNLTNPSAPEYQKPYNEVASCSKCWNIFTWIDVPPLEPDPENEQRVVIERNTR